MHDYLKNIIFLISAVLLLLAPILYSGKTTFALMILEFIGLILLAFNLIESFFKPKPYNITSFFIIFSLSSILLYLLPLPIDYWQTLPNRIYYLAVVEWLNTIHIQANLTFSLIPTNTIKAFLTLIPVIAIFFSVLKLDHDKNEKLIYLFIMLCFLEAILGLIQYASQNSVFFLGSAQIEGASLGTYLNRDHFAALMVMCLPFTLAITFNSAKKNHYNFFSSSSFHKLLLFSAVSILLMLAAIFSMSRAGIFLTLTAFFLSSTIFSNHLGGKRSTGIVMTITISATSLMISIGLIPILNRFISHDPLEDGRWIIWEHTIEGIKNFWPLGSGPGTFPDVYRALQPIEQLGFINHAHNDYLEILFDMGIFGLFIIIAFISLYCYGWFRLRKKHWNPHLAFQYAAGISIFLILLHSFVDFNLHTPANMIIFGFLCGLFFSESNDSKKAQD